MAASGLAALVLAAVSTAMILAVPFFTMFGARYFPERWFVTVLGGLVPTLIAWSGFLTGLRRHDKGDERGAGRAFAASWLSLPFVAMAVAYLTDQWRP